jgi:hypothetical protein
LKPEGPRKVTAPGSIKPITLVEPDLPSCWKDVNDALAAGIDRLILFGPPGTGKTFGGLNLGDVTGGAFRLICNEDMTAAERREKVRIMQQILRNDAQVRLLTEPWVGELDKLLSPNTAKQMH